MNKVREIVLLSTLGEDADSCLAWEDGIYDEKTSKFVYEEVDEDITYTDLDRCYQEVTKVFQRSCDNKYFQWSYIYSAHHGLREYDKQLTEVFPYTHEVTGYL
jgi:hypothetical protein